MPIKTGRCPKCRTRYYQRFDGVYICECQITKKDGSLMSAYQPVVDSLTYGSRAMNAVRNAKDRNQRDWRIRFWDGTVKDEDARPLEVRLKPWR
ncbi:MAG: hypothetical protein QXJ75_05625 [Candidatus Bathyarchaeia archaeon]